MADSHNLGKMGEGVAVKHLKDNGYKILHRNWVTGKREIDIIAEDDEYIVFVEVKTRMVDFQLNPRDAVTVPKQRNLVFAAQTWIERNKPEKEVRFDVITVINDGHYNKIEHIKHAFYPTL
jgi:putative endonuclease